MMQRFLKFFLFISITLISCGEVEPIDPAVINDGNNNNNNGQPSLTATFNNQNFTATGFQALKTGGAIIIQGFRSNGSNFTFALSGTTTGTYLANDINHMIYYQPAGTDFVYWGYHPSDASANTGAVVITNIDTVNKTISGTFQFTGFWSNTDDNLPSISFTNGVFNNIPYTEDAMGDDEFTATVNGQNFETNFISTGEIGTGSQSFIFVSGIDVNGNVINVNMKSILGPGTYSITTNIGSDDVQLAYQIPSQDFEAFATSGSVTIIEKTDERIKGTFNGTITGGGAIYQITNGTFDVEF
jgi:hypothetical protein